MFASSLLHICSAVTSCTRQITFGCVVLLAKEKMRRYESGAAKRKKLTAAKTEIAKLTKLDSFFQASESSSLDTCTSVTSTQNQTDDATRTVLPEAAMVTDLDTSTCACTGRSSSHVDTVHRGDEALSNCPAPADTSEQSASKADPAIDGNMPILETYRCPLCSC